MKRIQSILLACLIVFLAACEKDTEAAHFAPSVNTGNATDIYRKGATLAGTIELAGNASAESYGILFSRMKSMTEYTEYPITSGETDYKVKVKNLEQGSTYYYCAYAYSGYNMVLGEVKNFTTTENNPPVFDELTMDSIGADRVMLSTEILDDGGAEILLSGFCWKEGNSGVATFIDNVVNVTSVENGRLRAEITGLVPNTDYVFSAYSVNTHGMGFSESYVIRTAETRVPTLSDIIVTSQGNFNIHFKAQITDIGTSDIIEAGLCWSKENSEPTIEDSTLDLTDGLVEDNYWMYIEHNAASNTTYYYRFYAKNEVGIGYSKVLVFTTPESSGYHSTVEDLPTHDWE